jgi:DNA-binding transcriptional ArsR family regulator
MSGLAEIMRVFASKPRLQILDWLKEPRAHFREQIDGDLVEDGVCGLLIAEKLEVRQPTITGHMRLLVDVGAVRAKRVKQWTFYRRDEERIRALKAAIVDEL